MSRTILVTVLSTIGHKIQQYIRTIFEKLIIRVNIIIAPISVEF